MVLSKSTKNFVIFKITYNKIEKNSVSYRCKNIGHTNVRVQSELALLCRARMHHNKNTMIDNVFIISLTRIIMKWF